MWQATITHLSPYNIVTIRRPHYTRHGAYRLGFCVHSLRGSWSCRTGKRKASNRPVLAGPHACLDSGKTTPSPRHPSQVGSATAAGVVPGFAFFNSDVSDYLRQVNHTDNGTRRGGGRC